MVNSNYRTELAGDKSLRLYLSNAPYQSIIINPPSTVSQEDLIKVTNLILTAIETLKFEHEPNTEHLTG